MTEERFLSYFWDAHIRIVDAHLRESGKDYVSGTNAPTVADFKMFGQVGMALADTNDGTFVPKEVQAKIREKIKAVPTYKDWH